MISDRGLASLKSLTALEWIDVGKLNVSAAGLVRLATGVPGAGKVSVTV